MPAIPAPEPGLVIRYDYLWTQDAAACRTLGKDRPACIIVVVDKPGKPLFAALLPITHTPPSSPDEALEIPPNTRIRLGLDHQPCWVKISEYNIELWPPPGLSVVPGTDNFTYGFLPPRFFETVKRNFQTALSKGLTKQISRLAKTT